MISVCSLLLGLGWLSPSDAATTADPQVMHILNRLSFGPRPGDVETVQNMGVEAYLQQQLHPESLPEPPALTAQLAQLETLNQTPLQLIKQL